MEEKSFKMCRLCPSDEHLSDLYHPLNLEVRKVLNLFVNIEDESSTKLPKFICEVCEHIVQSIIEFRDKCKERDNQLRELVESDSKIFIKMEDTEKETLPIEVLIIKEEEDDLPDESDFVEVLVQYSDDPSEEESSEEEKKPKKKTMKTETKKDWPCLLCKNVYSNWTELNTHKNTDHLQCPVCLKSFKSYRLMAHHKGNVHVGGTECHLCGKHIINRTRLSRHIRAVHTMERNHKCEICGAGFLHKSKLKTHLSSHNDLNSVMCDFENCEKMFKNMTCLNYHKKSHSLVPVIPKKQPSKTIVCQYCGKILKTTTGYQIHMRVHKNEKPFNCSVCDKTFRDKGSLVIHERIHKDERPYQCDLCPKNFNIQKSLKRHKICVHETEMKHECHICGKRTKIKSNLTLHMKIHGIGSKKNDLNKLELN